MKKLLPLIILLFSIIGNNVYSQTKQVKYTIKCKMSVERIMQEQEIIKDTHEYAKANKLAEVLLSEITQFYDEINNSDEENIQKHINVINSAIESADIIGMDYSMLEQDIRFINSFKN